MPKLRRKPPTTLDHIQEAKRNYDFYLQLTQEDSEHRWAVVVLFYSALHLVQAYAVKRGLRPRNHEDREDFLDGYLGMLASPYRRLRNEAGRARYQLQPPPAKRLNLYHDEDFWEIVKELKRRNIFWEEDEGAVPGCGSAG